jgi:hypothetical protein
MMLILFFLCSTSGAEECLQLRAVTLLPVHLQIHPARLRGVLPQGAPAQMVQRLLPLPVMCMRNQHECNNGCKFFLSFQISPATQACMTEEPRYFSTSSILGTQIIVACCRLWIPLITEFLSIIILLNLLVGKKDRTVI